MSGLSSTLNIGITALAAQQYGMDVSSHNIANINTPDYSRQNPVYAAKRPSIMGSLLIGRGVDTAEVIRSSDQFLEDHLRQQESNLMASEEMEKYMKIVEGLFGENTGTSLSAMISDYWNLWQDIANNPSGASERIALYEHSSMLSDQFKSLDESLTQIETDLTRTVNADLVKVNEITYEIAQLNKEIIKMETRGPANDLRDRRNSLISELAQFINVKTFQQSSGSVTVVTAKGCILVQQDSSYELEVGGVNGDKIKWQGSDGSSVDITNYINEGKIGGCLDMRDVIVAKYKLDLDAMAGEFIFAVNKQHSQGVGLKLIQPGSTITGSYETDTDLGGLHFGGDIQFISEGFKIWIEDRTVSTNPTTNSVSIDLSSLNSGSSLSDLAIAINNQITAVGLNGVTADGSGTAITFSATSDYAFGFSNDDSNILAVLGVNTFFKGTGSESIDVNDVVKNDKDFIAAAKIDANGNYALGDNENAFSIGDLQYATIQIPQWTCDRIDGNKEGSTTTTIEDFYHAMVGSIGITASGISKGRSFNEIMVNRLSEIRDNVSGVSIDEEMANLIKFQQAYAAAAKLITVSDEMLDMLLAIKK